jgi:hypothetical protein
LEHFVRAYFTAQTFDQLRNMTALTVDIPPATMQLLAPGATQWDTNPDVPDATFRALLTKAINN